jgi:hypothetical protein
MHGVSAQMETLVDKFTHYFTVVASAAFAAAVVAYVAHYDFGLSRREIRFDALIGAATLAGGIVLIQRQRTKS